MKKLLLLLSMIISFGAMAQTTTKKLVADETYYQESGTKNFKIITSNEAVRTEITKISTFTSMCTKKHSDRRGSYWEYTYVFPLESQNKVVALLNKLNKP